MVKIWKLYKFKKQIFKMKNYSINKSDFKKLYDIACKDWKGKFNDKFKEQTFEDNLSFDESFLKEMKTACDEKQLKVFNKLFSEFIDTSDFTKFNTYSKVCKELNEEELEESDFKFLYKDQRKRSLAQAKINQLERFFNGKFKKDWTNTSVCVYSPYFTVSGSGCLVFYYSYLWLSYFYGDPGLYQSKEISDFIGKNDEFRGFYQDLL